MIGYHSVSVITDAYFKGIPFSNYPELYEGMLSIANRSKLGIPAYKRFGYIPSHSESESVSKTLEYAYNDWCISKMALAFRDTLNYLDFNKRAQFSCTSTLCLSGCWRWLRKNVFQCIFRSRVSGLPDVCIKVSTNPGGSL